MTYSAGLLGTIINHLLKALFTGIIDHNYSYLDIGLNIYRSFRLYNPELSPFGILSNGLRIGIIAILVDGISNRFREIRIIERPVSFWRRLRSSLYASLFWGLIYYLFFVLFFVAKNGLSSWLSSMIVSIMYGLSGLVIGSLVGEFIKVQLSIHRDRSWKTLNSNLFWGMLSGALVGLSFSLIFGLPSILSVRNLLPSLILFIPPGLISGLFFGLIFERIVGVDISNTMAAHVPSHRIWLSMQYTIGQYARSK